MRPKPAGTTDVFQTLSLAIYRLTKMKSKQKRLIKQSALSVSFTRVTNSCCNCSKLPKKKIESSQRDNYTLIYSSMRITFDTPDIC